MHIQKCILSRIDIQDYCIFHTDNDPLFCSKEFTRFAELNKILLSKSETYSHGNKVSERLNRTVKTDLSRLIYIIKTFNTDLDDIKQTLIKNLRKSLQSKVIGIKYPSKIRTFDLLKRFNINVINEIIDVYIQSYNNQSYRGERMFSMSPNNVN